MTALLLGLVLTIDPGAAVFKDVDGGWTIRTTVGGSSGGPSSSVTVTNFPATQPVSGTVNVSNFDGGVWISSMPQVTIANFPGSQVVSGSVSVSNFPATQPVSGTFWQATQPVSIATMPSTPVTGTFWQATQPVSLASVPSHAVTVASGGVASGAIASGAVASGAIAAGAIGGSNPCINPTSTILGVSGNTSGTASVQLVAISGTTKIYVCSMNVTGVSGTTPTFKLQYGTGAACATGTVGIVGPFTTAANTTYNFVGPTFAVTTAGQALCYVQTGTTPINTYNITYVQQ